jgi:peptidoglycan-associated lipoprotein
MYFTRCERIGDIHKRCEIYKSVKKHNTWLAPERVLYDSTANIGQPTLSVDELTILFSSDWRGTKGGKDIWMATRDSVTGNFKNPVNLGSTINTKGDELFPYLYNDSILFFASDGHPGYGGLDIYKSVYREGKWSAPANLLSPINSGYDDFGIQVEILGESGYITSNKPGGLGHDDIYRFVPDPYLFTASGQVKDLMNLLPVEGATVELIGKNGKTFFRTTDGEGMFHFSTVEVLEGKDYDLIAGKQNYFSAKESFHTRNFIGDRDFNFELVIEPIPESPIVLPDILFPLDEWTLEPQYQDSLLQLVEIMDLNESLIIELRSHTDSRASIAYNDNLSQKRAQAVVDFLISRGIDPGRMVAKGYGERIPRTLKKDIMKDGYLFQKGTLLDDEFVLSLPTKEIQEAAFHLNRRTEFAVIAKDYSPDKKASERSPVIQIVSDSTDQELPFTINAEGEIIVESYLNDFGVDTKIIEGTGNSSIDAAIVIELLQKKAINRNDFEGEFEKVLVNGQIAENTIVNIKKIRFGETIVDNVKVAVRTNNDGFFIVGSDILGKAGNVSIDNEKKVIIFK